MSHENLFYHPRLIINEHFDKILNQIDVKTELLLAKPEIRNQKEVEVDLNETRKRQIEMLKEIERLNFNHLTKFDFENEYDQIWSSVLDENVLSYEQKKELYSERIRERIIKYDCVLFENAKLSNGLDLWIMPWSYNQMNLEFFK